MTVALVPMNAPEGDDAPVVGRSAALLKRNAERIHLSPAQLRWSEAQHAAALPRAGDNIIRVAIVVDGAVVGRVDLNPVDHPAAGGAVPDLPMGVRRQAAVGQGMARKEAVRVDAVA